MKRVWRLWIKLSFIHFPFAPFCPLRFSCYFSSFSFILRDFSAILAIFRFIQSRAIKSLKDARPSSLLELQRKSLTFIWTWQFLKAFIGLYFISSISVISQILVWFNVMGSRYLGAEITDLIMWFGFSKGIETFKNGKAMFLQNFSGSVWVFENYKMAHSQHFSKVLATFL